MHLPSKLAEFVWTCVGILLQPTTIVALFAPTFLHFNLKIVKQDSLLNTISDKGLILSLNNPWTVAITEWEIQFYTYIIGFIALIAQVIFYYIKVQQRKYFKNKRSKVRSDVFVIIAVLLTLLNMGMFFTIATGHASSLEVLNMYKPPIDDLDAFSFAWPPLKSPITQGRYLVAITGAAVLIAVSRYQNRLA